MTATPGRIGAAASIIAKEWPGFFWSFGPGRMDTNEPMWGVLILDPNDPSIVIAQAEDDDPLKCVQKLRLQRQ